ncbi:hypothetical protein [Paraburkholderia adhaesiva]|uniref:hypothetical protein n=1 Tax=Paraburkholderia adhaesiva TaxID=2883244 RepID=UPI001F21745D|nr:hypothetical protein [Paraburkholderia adhaesiva]
MNRFSLNTEEYCQKIRAAMRSRSSWSAFELSQILHIAASSLLQQLHRMAAAGTLVQKFDGKRYLYSLPQSSNCEPEKAMRPTGQLTGYDEQMRQFRELCMSSRPALESFSAIAKPRQPITPSEAGQRRTRGTIEQAPAAATHQTPITATLKPSRTRGK